MSLILEALRKSEAERRLGQVPDLLAPLPAQAVPPRRRARRGLLFAGALIAVAAGAWWLGQRQATLPGAAYPPVASPDTPPVVAPTASPTPAAAPPADMESPLPAPATPGATTSTASVAPTPAMPRPAPPAATPPVSGGSEAAAAANARSGPASDAELAALRARLEAAATAAAPPRAPAAALPAAADATDAPLPIDLLSAAERSALPPLRLTMHVYTEDPAQRFVILDGQRRTEGTLLGDSLRLEAIRRDGVVLDLGGRRVLLPRP
ncbi:general secretion pathway protein GspB [Rehaibacterium terrae]|jgi:general secretion pathway protein B|uniref:General secretion pathway protein B n=1 Tax=Rehaibacterium terrae TaxID=1341696 RepID=A0A7W7XYD2_9GAMM|nr:general secretion pathway protein GspB [Rehaibacterium terrae]MBB5014645.1 general secretion pathway protein B [Rehaibacterium terrae]